MGTTKRHTVDFQVTGTQTISLDTLSIVNGEENVFRLENDNCSGKTLLGPDACSFDILFAPASLGDHTANLLLPLFLPATHTINAGLAFTAVENELPDDPTALPWLPLLLLDR